MNHMRGVFSALLTTVVCLVLVAAIAWFTVPRFTGHTPLVILSGSMEPALPLGGVTFVEPRTADQVHVGDILTFRHPEKPNVLVTHRVAAIEHSADGTPSFVTRGDANNSDDGWTVQPAHVVGVAELTLPYLGYVTQRVQGPLGFLFIVGLPALYLAVGEVQNIVRELRRRPTPESEAAA